MRIHIKLTYPVNRNGLKCWTKIERKQMRLCANTSDTNAAHIPTMEESKDARPGQPLFMCMTMPCHCARWIEQQQQKIGHNTMESVVQRRFTVPRHAPLKKSCRARAPFPQSNRPPPSTVSQPDPASIVITIERYARGMLRYVPRTQPSKHDEYLCRMQVHNNKYETILDG